MPEKVHLIGGYGYIGSHLLAELQSHHDRFSTQVYSRQNPLNTNVDNGTVIYLAGQNRPGFSISRESINLWETLNSVSPGCRFVLCSSVLVYDANNEGIVDEQSPINPVSPYAIYKAASELMVSYICKLKDIPYSILRISNVYGRSGNKGGFGMVLDAYKSESKTPIEILQSGLTNKDYIYIVDVVNIFLKLLTTGIQPELININSGDKFNLLDIIRLLNLKRSEPLDFAFNPNIVVRSALSISNERMVTTLGYHPQYNLYKGIEDTVNYLGIAK